MGPTILLTTCAPLEQRGQRFDCVLNLGNFVVRGFDAGNFLDNGLYFGCVAGRRPIKGMLYSRRYSQTRRPV